MEETLSALVGAVNLILWDYMLIYALLGIGLFFTLYLGAPQITKLGAGFKSVFGGLFSKKDKDDKFLPKPCSRKNTASSATANTSAAPRSTSRMV